MGTNPNFSYISNFINEGGLQQMKKNRLLVSALSMCLVLAQMPVSAFAATPDNAQAVLTGGVNPRS